MAGLSAAGLAADTGEHPLQTGRFHRPWGCLAMEAGNRVR
jgi:hypothetical protein